MERDFLTGGGQARTVGTVNARPRLVAQLLSLQAAASNRSSFPTRTASATSASSTSTVVETKKAAKPDGLEEGVQQIRRYHKETPELFTSSQVFEVTKLVDFVKSSQDQSVF